MKAVEEIKPACGRAEGRTGPAVGASSPRRSCWRRSGHMGGELIRLGTPAVLLLGLLKSSADVLRQSSSLVHFPHMD